MKNLLLLSLFALVLAVKPDTSFAQNNRVYWASQLRCTPQGSASPYQELKVMMDTSDIIGSLVLKQTYNDSSIQWQSVEQNDLDAGLIRFKDRQGAVYRLKRLTPIVWQLILPAASGSSMINMDCRKSAADDQSL